MRVLADHPLITLELAVAISDDVGVLVRAGQDDSPVGRLPAVLRSRLRRGAEAARACRGTCAAAAGAIQPAAVPRCTARRRRLLAVLRTLERALPAVAEIRQQLREYQPDVVLITPLVYLGSWQFEVLRAAQAEGLRTVFCRRQLGPPVEQGADPRRAAPRVRLERDAEGRGRAPARRARRSRRRDRRAVLRPVVRPGCRSARARSSVAMSGCPQIGRSSCMSARRCSGAVLSRRSSCAGGSRAFARARIPELRTAAILIRPHPARMDEWKTIDLSRFEHVALYGSNPMDAASKEDYFESLYYSSAVVGLNTSAFLEAAIVDRPVHTILTPEFADNQEGTLHFHYLLNVGGGVLRTSTQLRGAPRAARRVAAIRRQRRIGHQSAVRARVHPAARSARRPATPVFCDALEAIPCASGAAPERTPWHLLLVRWATYPVFLVLWRMYGAELFRDDWRRTDREHQQRLEAHEQERQARARAAEDTKRDRERRRAAKVAARESAVNAAEAERQKAQSEKARQREAKSREKAARERQRRRAELRARLVHRAKGLLGSRHGGAATDMSQEGAVRRLVARLSGQRLLDQIAVVEEKVGAFGRAQREALAAQRRQIETLQAGMSTRASAEAVRSLEQRVEAIQQQVKHQDRTVSEALERAHVLDDQGMDDRRFTRRIEELLRHERPVIVGPWTGEVGFELIYWVPFVRWVVADLPHSARASVGRVAGRDAGPGTGTWRRAMWTRSSSSRPMSSARRPRRPRSSGAWAPSMLSSPSA